MKVGDLVWNHYHGLLRFGTVVGKNVKKDGWAYFTVDWYADDKYEKSQKWRKKLTGIDYTLKEYRGTQLKTFNPERLEQILIERSNKERNDKKN